MTKRMLLALGAALLSVATVIAQSPAVTTPVVPAPQQPSTHSDEGAPPSAMPTSPSTSPNDENAFWAEVDYQLSWLRAVTLPALVTTSPPGTAKNVAGILGAPTTATLFGGGPAFDGARNGFHIAAGYWYGSDHLVGVEADFRLIGGASTSFSGSSSSFPILARPFTDASNFTPQAVLVAFPGSSTGSIAAQASADTFVQAHLDFATRLLDDGGPLRATLLIGYCFFQYNEGLHVQQVIQPVGPNFIPGTQFSATDDFTTHNQFHGFDFGIRPQYTWQSLTLDLSVRVAVGALQHDVAINGSQLIVVPGQPTIVQNAGVLAQASNIGSHGSTDWSVIPEAGFGVSWRVNSYLQLRLGYSALFLNGVARAGDQVNTNLNPHFFPGGNAALGGPNQPAFSLNRTDIWIQSVSAGVLFTY
jgi:hypothetical protein